MRMSYDEQTCNNTVVPSFSNNIITGAYWHINLAVINPSGSLPYNITVSCSVGNQNNISSCPYNPGCQAGYEWNYTTSSCKFIYDPNDSNFGPIYDSTPITSITQAVTGTGIIFGFAVALLTRTWPQDVLSIIHFLQLVLTLPLIAIAMSNEVKEFIVSNAFSAL